MSPTPDDIHRTSEVTRLAKVLEDPPEGLSIVGISGPGGVGKTFLLTHVLETIGPEKLGYLVLTANASNPDSRSDFFGILEGQLFRRSLQPPADRTKDYFPGLRKVADIHRSLVEEARNEMANKGAPESVQRVAAALLLTGRLLNGAIPKVRFVSLPIADIDPSEMAKVIDDAWKLGGGLRSLRDSTMLSGPVRDLVGITKKNRVKRDLYSVTAEELRADLSAALVGYEEKDRLKNKHARIPGLNRLLVIIDDYEAFDDLLEEFLVGALVPELAKAPFRTVLVILGRDDIETTHPSWAQHCRRYLRAQIRLAPFTREDANDLFRAASVPENRWQSLYDATQGYPFLMNLALEETADYAGDSVLFLRKFYDRITRWLNDRERDWLARVCYLDRIDEDSLRTVFPDESLSRIQAIQDWFEREPSLRDPSATYFRMRPMVREKLLRYLEVRAPSRHRELSALAEKANHDSSNQLI